MANSFQLRFYDARIGRWMSPDPAKQFHSPYLAMGNSPINGVDPDGAYFVVDDFLFGFIGGLFQKRDNFNDGSRSRFGNAIANGSRLASNSAKLWGGIGYTDKEKTTAGKILQVASRLTLELPQTLVGVLSAQTIGYFNGVESISNFRGATLLRTKSETAWKDEKGNQWGFDWGFTVGSYISVNELASPDLIRHEYGHYLVSRRQGPLYLPLNILSLVSVNFGEKFHGSMPWEKWADNRSHIFFKGSRKN